MNTATKDVSRSLRKRANANVADRVGMDATVYARIKNTLDGPAARSWKLTGLRKVSLETMVNMLLWAVELYVLAFLLKLFLD